MYRFSGCYGFRTASSFGSSISRLSSDLAAFFRLGFFAAACTGTVSQYHTESPIAPPKNTDPTAVNHIAIAETRW